MTTNSQTPNSVETEQRILALEQQLLELRLAQQSTELRRAGSRRVAARLLAGGSIGVALFASAAAVSQTCPAGIPFCFQTGNPIRAAEVNSNFAAIATSLSGKLGVTAQGDVDVAGTLGIKIKTKNCTPAASGASQCSCDTGELAIAGGASAPAGAFLATSRPKASERETWEVNCRKADGTDAMCAEIRAVCAKIKSL